MEHRGRIWELKGQLYFYWHTTSCIGTNHQVWTVPLRLRHWSSPTANSSAATHVTVKTAGNRTESWMEPWCRGWGGISWCWGVVSWGAGGMYAVNRRKDGLVVQIFCECFGEQMFPGLAPGDNNQTIVINAAWFLGWYSLWSRLS